MAFLIYTVSIVAIVMTLYAGYLGWKFYVDEIIRRK